MSIHKLEIELDSLIFDNQWILNEDIEKIDLEEKIDRGNSIELNDNFEYINRNNKNTKLIISELKKIVFENESKYKTSMVIYNLLDKTSINNKNILNFEDMNNKILEILIFLIKNKFIYNKYKPETSFNLKTNKNIMNIFTNIIDNCSSEDILENMIRLFDTKEKNNKKEETRLDQIKLFFDIESNEIGKNTKIEGLSNYDFNKSSTSRSRKFLYNFVSYKYINQTKYNISNNYLLFFEIFKELNKSFDTKTTIKDDIKIQDIFLFCKNTKHSDIKSSLESLFRFDDITENVQTFEFKPFIDIYIQKNELKDTTNKEFIYNQLYYNDIKVDNITKINKNTFKTNLLVNENTKLIKQENLTSTNFGRDMAILYNIIVGDSFTKKLMYSKSYKANLIIALEKYLCILFGIFTNIKNKINEFIKEIIPDINTSDLENKKMIVDYLYDLKRIYTFENIFNKNLEFVYTSNKDYDNVIYNTEIKNKNKVEEKNIRINNFYNKCNNDNGFLYNLIDIVKYMNLFKRKEELFILFKKDKLEIKDTYSISKKLSEEQDINLKNAIFIDNSKIEDKMIKTVKIEYNPYGLINILNLIINKNSTYHNGLQLIHDSNDEIFKKIYTNSVEILNKYNTIYHKKHSIECKKIVSRLLEYFENGIPLIQYKLILNEIEKNNYYEIYTIMLRSLVKNIKSYYTKGVKKTYKTFYFNVILNYHNQIKVFISILKKKGKKKELQKCLKLKIKYSKKIKKLFTDESIYKAFAKASEHTFELTQLQKEKNIVKNVYKAPNKCIIFIKSIKIKDNIDIKQSLNDILKPIKSKYTIQKQLTMVKGIFENIFLNIGYKYKLYIPIFVTNIGRYIIPNKYKYLDIKLFYEFLNDETIYEENDIKLILKKMRISINSFESDNMFIDEIDDDESEKIYIVVCNKNTERNNSNLWRKLDFYKFMYNFIYSKNLTAKKTHLKALKQLLNYLFDMKIYKKYTTKIWVPFSKSLTQKIISTNI